MSQKDWKKAGWSKDSKGCWRQKISTAPKPTPKSEPYNHEHHMAMAEYHHSQYYRGRDPSEYEQTGPSRFDVKRRS